MGKKVHISAFQNPKMEMYLPFMDSSIKIFGLQGSKIPRFFYGHSGISPLKAVFFLLIVFLYNKMMKAALVFLVYCILVALAQQDNGGFIRGPGGVLLHPDCHVGKFENSIYIYIYIYILLSTLILYHILILFIVLPDGARMVDQETIILADGTRQEIPPCIHTSPENNTQVSRGYGLFCLYLPFVSLSIFLYYGL